MNKKKHITAFLILIYTLLVIIANVSADKDDKKQQKTQADSPKIERRAFYTAPPVIPHKVTSRGSRACLTCHKKVFKVGGQISIKTPHPQYSNCLQCHVQGRLTDLPEVDNYWIGLKEPKNSTQAHEFSPPTIPHRTFLRENCLSCHGPKNADKTLRTPHPERSNCMQCHVGISENEFEIDDDY